MIERSWQPWTSRDSADAYEALQHAQIVPELLRGSAVPDAAHAFPKRFEATARHVDQKHIRTRAKEASHVT